MDDAMIEHLTALRSKALEKYGLIANNYEGMGALQLEFDEVKAAMQERKPRKIRLELLDVMNVCTRWIDAIDAEADHG